MADRGETGAPNGQRGGQTVAIVGGGPAGLAAAEVLARAGLSVTIHDAMPTVARKFLLAGKSGLNLTHAEDFARFRTRYGAANDWLAPALDALPPDDLRRWADDLGAETFVGSSQRVFPKAMKGSPLLRAWLARLASLGVTIHTRHRLVGLDGRRLRLETPEGILEESADAVLLATGGASWPRLGSDGTLLPMLAAQGVAVRAFAPANCGFDVAFSADFLARFAGAPVKSVMAQSSAGSSQGEFVISATGIEGSLVYGHASALRDDLAAGRAAIWRLDLTPGRTEARLAADFARQDRKASLSTRLRKGAGLDGVKAALLRELTPDLSTLDAPALAARIKALPIPVSAPRPIAEAISSAGGVCRAALDEGFMLTALPGVFVAGELLDWEAPTGGYLLTACFATGQAAARGMIAYLRRTP